jgi:hypothetical protein
MPNYYSFRNQLKNNMRKNILLIAAIALVGTGTLTLNSLLAQSSATPPAGGQPVSPPPGRPAGPRGRLGMYNYHGIAMTLKRVKAELEKSTDDYDGHRQSAIDACDKAAQELEAVQASVQAAAAAKAAAAKAAAAAAAAEQPPATATTPAPAATPAPNQ